MIKWTKKEIKALQSTLTSYLVICRDRFGRHPNFANLFTKQINEKRKEIIIAGLRDQLKVWHNYAKQNRDYVEHCKAHPRGI